MQMHSISNFLSELLQASSTQLEYSVHWKKKRKYRKDITDTLLELAISKGKTTRDRRWSDAYNTLIKVPSSGRVLKVVYKRTGMQTYKIITAYWLD
jgi:hypothetical protein